MHSLHFFASVILTASPLVSAHGLIASVTGNLGGKGSRLSVAASGDQNLGDVTVFKAGAEAFGATGAVSSLIPAITALYYHTDRFLRAATSSQPPTLLQ
jgi:hypothetical protein